MMIAAMTKPAMAAPVLKLHPNAVFGEVSKTGHSLQTRTDRANPETGTMHAVSYFPLGVPVLFTCTTGKRGGARNRRDRVSHGMTLSQVGKIIEATDHAARIGLPFNRMITVHWQAAGIGPEGVVQATGRYLDMLSKALSRRQSQSQPGTATAWLWVQENGHRKGAHVHILAHVPTSLADLVKHRQRGWLRSITGNPYRASVIKSDPIGGRLGVETSNPPHHAANLNAALAYVLKGATAEAAQAFELTRLEPGGRCIGKRCGFSQNIGPKARATAGATK